MTVLQVVGYGFAAAVTWSCVRHIASGDLKEDLSAFKGRPGREWAEYILGGMASIAAVVGIAFASDYGPKILQWTWLKLFATKGEKVIGNQMLAGASIPYFGVLFMLLLAVNLPRMARIEEEEFRDGTKDWKDAVPRSLKFGLMHMIVGVPLWLGLALAIPGMWFTSQYFKGGVDRSSRAHAVYNLMLSPILLILAIKSIQ